LESIAREKLALGSIARQKFALEITVLLTKKIAVGTITR
jgi:hypothetical protein